ncbi:tautomerase family protein [Paenibacillus daejeonensis]|uniref:tautomerase family protein n=1 Tax=Paenibacillus daejeonensis TaxID=135193 RepID=UPI000362AFB4|nr:tautomerase family protein [Paenibacillus daejeonensis]
MAQFKIYGLKDRLNPIKAELSDIIHATVITAFQLPADKRFQRFFPMDREDFYYPEDRSDAYTVIEVSMFEGRSVETKKQFYRLLFQAIQSQLGIDPQDVEITITETPRANWGIRGLPADELNLNYRVDV